MIETLLTAFTTFFATIGPVEAAVLFTTLTPRMDGAQRRQIAIRATVIAGLILLVFTVLGQPLLARLGVGIPALQTAGGIVLLLISLDMIFARPGSSFKLSPPEGEEAQGRDDLAVFPIATPLLAGPGAMSAGILLAANASAEPARLAAVIGALGLVMVVTLVLLLAAHEVSRVLGVTAQRVLMRVFGILLAAIAVQSTFDGIGASGLLRR